MKQSRVSAFARVARWSGRFGRAGVLAAVALMLGAGSLLAQGATGKLEGRVRDQTGAPIANAQVLIVGTAFNATTNDEGYYFINNVPAGVIDVRGQFVGYRPTQVENVRMLAGQTITQDITMEATPVEITELTVVEAIQPLVPRDEVTTKQRVSGEYTDRLPVDRVNQVLALQPGVVASTSGNTLSIRGSRSSENATYIDGVPVQRGNQGGGFVDVSDNAELVLGTNALEEASVTTGAASAEFGNAQGGIISFQTRSGSTQGYNGGLSFETDEVFGKGGGLGYNRLQASVGGPTRLIDGLTFFLSGVLEGQKATQVGFDADENPIFVQAGIDTIVQAGERIDTVYNFAVGRGDCDLFSNSTNPDIADNYGEGCGGIRTPGTTSNGYQMQGKLNYTYGTGSRLALTLLGSQNQGRQFGYQTSFLPDDQFGTRSNSRYAILSWTQNLARSSERALALDASLSYQADRFIQSPFEPGEVPDDGFLGMRVTPYDFRYDFDEWEVTEELVTAFRNNDQTFGRAPCLEPLVPNAAVCEYTNDIRNNPYALDLFPESGGPLGRLQQYKENRLIGKASLDWQFDRYNRVRFGGEFTRYDITNYSHSLNSQAFSDVYMEEPLRWNAYVEDRLDLGDVVVVGGLRYDWYKSNASRPFFTCTPELAADDANAADEFCDGIVPIGESRYWPRLVSSPNVGGETTIDDILVEDEAHSYLSPHVQVSFPVTDRTNFRLSYAHQVQSPDFGLILGGINTDFGITNSNHIFGADLDFGRTIAFEFGVRHAFSDDMVLDVAAYNKDNLSNSAARLLQLYDPGVGRTNDIRILTNEDFGNTRGVDVRIDRRFGNLFNGTVAYSYQDARNTGSDPFTYTTFGSRLIQSLAGGSAPPPQATAPTTLSRPHSLATAASLTFPNDWNEGSTVGTILQNASIFATFRYSSGTAYTQCDPEGNEGVTSGQVCDRGLIVGGLNSARLPSFKELNMVLRKGFNLGGIDATAYLDARNVLNWRNITAVFVATNDVVSPVEFQENLDIRLDTYERQAAANGIFDEDDRSIDLTFGGAGQAGCAGFVNTGGEPVVADCVYLIRAEQRFGDGDGIFSLEEQTAAYRSFYHANGRGINSFTAPGRRMRVGLELNF